MGVFHFSISFISIVNIRKKWPNFSRWFRIINSNKSAMLIDLPHCKRILCWFCLCERDQYLLSVEMSLSSFHSDFILSLNYLKQDLRILTYSEDKKSVVPFLTFEPLGYNEIIWKRCDWLSDTSLWRSLLYS